MGFTAEVLESYSVGPGRAGISEGSAGENSAAAVTQQVKCSAFSLVMFSFIFNLIIVAIHLNYKYSVFNIFSFIYLGNIEKNNFML